MRAAKEPAEPERDGDRGIGLRFDGVAHCAFKRAGGLLRRFIGAVGQIGGSVARVLIDIAGAPDESSLGPIAMSVNRLGTVYPSTEFYIEAVKKLGLIDPWNEYWDRYFKYELEPVEGGVRSRSNKDAVLEDSDYGSSHDIYPYWASLTMPVLLVYATREIMPGLGRIVRAADRERFEHDVPGSTVADVDANHYTVITVDETVAAVQRFLGLS